MTLTSIFQIGRSALTTSQIGLQVAGNNMANLATPGYTRQTALLEGIRGSVADQFIIGRGVQVGSVRRQIDEALQQRLRTGIAEEQAQAQIVGVMDQIEGLLGELSGFDLSTELSEFFNAWSAEGNLLDTQTSLITQGESLAQEIRRIEDGLSSLRRQIDGQVDAQVNRGNELLEEIAQVNVAIANAELGSNEANALRDQRERLVQELSQMIDVTVVNRSDGMINVLVGSETIVVGEESRGLDVERETVNGSLVTSIVVAADGTELDVRAGAIGGLLEARNGSVVETIDKIDELTAQLIFEVNKLHSTGINESWLSGETGFLKIPASDRTVALNDPANATLADLPFQAVNGGFVVEVKNNTTGTVQTVRIDVDLDGIDNTGAAGFADDTTAEDIRAALDAIGGISASFNSDGSLQIDADSGFSYGFSDDSSGALAVLGVNSFFDGTGATDIQVRQALVDDPTRATLGRMVDGRFVENGTALLVSDLNEEAIAALGGVSIPEFWDDQVQRIGVQSRSAQTAADATRTVRQSLEAQRAGISGVDIDEESINLLNFQRQYQGGARLISVADEMLQTLIALV